VNTANGRQENSCQDQYSNRTPQECNLGELTLDPTCSIQLLQHSTAMKLWTPEKLAVSQAAQKTVFLFQEMPRTIEVVYKLWDTFA
jgi:hypothetical protein